MSGGRQTTDGERGQRGRPSSRRVAVERALAVAAASVHLRGRHFAARPRVQWQLSPAAATGRSLQIQLERPHCHSSAMDSRRGRFEIFPTFHRAKCCESASSARGLAGALLASEWASSARCRNRSASTLDRADRWRRRARSTGGHTWNKFTRSLMLVVKPAAKSPRLAKKRIKSAGGAQSRSNAASNVAKFKREPRTQTQNRLIDARASVKLGVLVGWTRTACLSSAGRADSTANQLERGEWEIVERLKQQQQLVPTRTRRRRRRRQFVIGACQLWPGGPRRSGP